MTYHPTRSKDHEKRGPARFLEQFKRSKDMASYLRSYLRRVQELEDALWEIILYRNLADGEGVILDFLGRIVGRKREGLSDDDYRIAIRAQIRINRSVGKATDVIEVAILSMPDGVDFDYSESYPGAIVVEVLPLAGFNWSVLWRSLLQTKAGGVRLYLILSFSTPETTFTLADYDPGGYAVEVLDDSLGLGYTLDPTLGGSLTMVLES